MDCGRPGSIHHRAAHRWRSRRRLARARVMAAEFPPPDPRLVGKLTILKLEPGATLRRVNGGHGVAHSPEARPDAEASVEIGQLARLAPLEYERHRKEAAERLDVRASILDRL